MLAEVALRIRKNHVAHGLVIFDVAGAAAKMTIERIEDRFLDIGARHGRLRQAFQQHLAFVQKSGRAIAALERKVFDEGFLQHGKSTEAFV